MDNGVLRVDHVHIPRDQMLMRLSQVTKEGKYLKSDVPRQLAYDGGPESQVIDYTTQQSRLFPLLASAYAFRFVGDWLKWLYTDVTQRLQANEFSTLPEVHACTAGLKSLTTSVTADGIEECRKLCGGHGYLCSSGLPELFAVYVPACTYEGDNVVLLLQVARAEHLMQCACDVKKAEDWLRPSTIVQAFEARALRMAVGVAKHITDISKASSPEEGFSALAADLVEVATAHCQLIVVSKFIDRVQQEIAGHGVKEQLQNLCNIYALSLLHKHLGDFLSTGCITPKQGALANEQLRSLYSQVRPNAISLVDAFNYTDHYLGSVLGRYDGNVYPTLYDEAWKDPLNDSVVPDGFTY
ncbi:hypothetical protein J5N97_029751 [Dioscorea zingiberensis]|uniref:Acyl-CoA oxidase C-terminal domain-containing protein n=1 Tax=Dioscorea zingiberensis TaxID=325984 RepID=A0A9D5H3H7_9LILI|nr:hypothetical protein J5N97_029751 [Dioscorea zingiberensis]